MIPPSMWSNFERYGQVADIGSSPTAKQVWRDRAVSDLTAEDLDQRVLTTPTLANMMIAFSGLYHHQTIFLPNAGDPHLRVACRPYTKLTYWLNEEDIPQYNVLVKNDPIEYSGPEPRPFMYDQDMIWNWPLEFWIEHYDPAETQAHSVVMNAPWHRAAADIVDVWPYLKPLGTLVALLPKAELFGTHDDARKIRRWLAERDAGFGVLKPELYAKNQEQYGVVMVWVQKSREVMLLTDNSVSRKTP